MGLFAFIALCLAVGLVDWLIFKYAPIPQEIKTLILVVSIVVLVLIFLAALGLFSYDVQIPRIIGK